MLLTIPLLFVIFNIGTNNCKKELFTVAGLDGDHHAFNAARAFIPNGQGWTFHTLFRYLLPILWGKSVTLRNRLMMTDGCAQEYLSFIQNSGKNNNFKNSLNGLCDFHSGVVSFSKIVYPSVPKTGK